MQKQTLNISHADVEIELAVLTNTGTRGSILCIHGLGCTKESFEMMARVDALREYTCLCVDLPGFGESVHPKGFSYRMEDHAEVCGALIDTAGFTWFVTAWAASLVCC